MGKTVFLDTTQMVLVSTNSSGVLDHGMMLKGYIRNLGDPYTFPIIGISFEQVSEIRGRNNEYMEV